jgi:hypothetical protein
LLSITYVPTQITFKIPPPKVGKYKKGGKMFTSNSKKSRLNWAILCLVFGFLFFSVAGASASFACGKKCPAKSGSYTCAGHSQATSENSGESSEHSQAAITSQSTEKQSAPVAPALAKLTVKKKYTCPMHPEVMKAKAGKCPKCGMNLEKKEFYEVYACPMEGCPYMSEKGGKCSGCGMKLKKRLVSKEDYQGLTQPQMTYTCPMHPEVTSDKPGNCPKCGMKLEMQKPASKE